MISADATVLRIGGWGAVAVAAVLLVVALAEGRYGDGAVMAAFLVSAAASVAMARTIPAAASLAFALAVVYAGAGWAWGLFQRVERFDEVAHLVTGFALTPVLAFVVLGPWLAGWRAQRLRLAAAAVSLGISAGAVWEMGEWTLRQLTGRESLSLSLSDAITDMMLGAIGSAASLVTIWWGIRSREADASRGARPRSRSGHVA